MSKNLHDLSDDEFDDLFRQSAEKGNIDFDPDAWNKMSRKLDAATPQSNSAWSSNFLKRSRLSLLIFLLIMISGVYVLMKKPLDLLTATKAVETVTKKPDNRNAETSHSNNTVTKNIKEAPITESPKTWKKNTVKESSSIAIKTSKKQEGEEPLKYKILPMVKPSKSGRKVTSSASEQGERTFSIAKNTKKEPVKLKESSLEATVSLKQSNHNSIGLVSGNQDMQPVSQASVTDSTMYSQRLRLESPRLLSKHQLLTEVVLPMPEITFQASFPSKLQQLKVNTSFRKGFNIRLALSPDLSFIPSNGMSKVGSNWAALLEYRFNNRFSIQTGVIRSLKQYNAYPEQYQWAGYLSLQSPLKDIDATCKMLDIPLNIRYDLSTKPNGRWFVAGGFTSYIMLKETYQYNYANPSDPRIKYKGWEGETGSYPFSVFNLSAGYERRILRRLTFQVEPVIKTPLGKVGYGKVKLATAGAFFSVKYPF